MNQLIQILSTVLPVFIMLAVGMICRNTSLLNRDGVNALKTVVVNVTLPAVVFNAFVTMEYTKKSLMVPVIFYLICVLAWALGLVVRKFFNISRFIPYLTTGFEAGMLGYALYILLYGGDTVSRFASIDLGQTLFVFTFYKTLVGMENGSKSSAKQVFLDIIKTPIIIAIILGVAIGASGLYGAMDRAGVAAVLDSVTDFASAPTAAIILITIGFDLVLKSVSWTACFAALLARYSILIVLRIFAGFVMRWIGMGSDLDFALNIMLILPPPYVLPIFADDENEQTYLSSTISVMTGITLICFAFLAVFR